jgi:hypothetical protein
MPNSPQSMVVCGSFSLVVAYIDMRECAEESIRWPRLSSPGRATKVGRYLYKQTPALLYLSYPAAKSVSLVGG